jgi:hypothetical protein
MADSELEGSSATRRTASSETSQVPSESGSLPRQLMAATQALTVPLARGVHSGHPRGGVYPLSLCAVGRRRLAQQHMPHSEAVDHAEPDLFFTASGPRPARQGVRALGPV